MCGMRGPSGHLGIRRRLARFSRGRRPFLYLELDTWTGATGARASTVPAQVYRDHAHIRRNKEMETACGANGPSPGQRVCVCVSMSESTEARAQVKRLYQKAAVSQRQKSEKRVNEPSSWVVRQARVGGPIVSSGRASGDGGSFDLHLGTAQYRQPKYLEPCPSTSNV